MQLPRPSFLLVFLLLAATGCLIDPDVSVLYEAGSPDGPATPDAPVADQRRPDGPVPDGPAPDGPAPDAGKPDLPPIDLAVDKGPPPLPVGGARALAGFGANALQQHRWDSAGWSTTPVPTVKQQVLWSVNRVSHKTPAEELAAVITAQLSKTELHALSGSAGVWTVDWTSALPSKNAAKRGFDLELEQTSGDALLVFSQGTATPLYRTRSGGKWSAALPLPINDGPGPNPDLNTGEVLWVELVPRPALNEITLLYSDANADLAVITWDGTKWLPGSGKVLETKLQGNINTGEAMLRAFDGEYESLSGKLLVAWGRENVEGYQWVSRSPFGAWGVTANVKIVTGLIEFLELTANPTTNQIAGAFLDSGGTDRLGLAIWDGGGNAWKDSHADNTIRDFNDLAQGDFPLGLGWLGATAVCIYPDNNTDALDWHVWVQGFGWSKQLDLPVTGKGFTESAEVISIPGKKKLLALVSDTKNQLWAFEFNGQVWAVSPGGSPLQKQLSSTSTKSFSVAVRVK